jgi:hypothetical protein
MDVTKASIIILISVFYVIFCFASLPFFIITAFVVSPILFLFYRYCKVQHKFTKLTNLIDDNIIEIKKQFKSVFKAIFTLVIVITVIGIVGYSIWWFSYSVFYGPSTKIDIWKSSSTLFCANPDKLFNTEFALRTSFIEQMGTDYLHLNDQAQFIVYRNGNLDIFLKDYQYQSIPFPNRAETIKNISSIWCDSIKHTYLPKVKFRDIKTGKTLASCGCFTSIVVAK